MKYCKIAHTNLIHYLAFFWDESTAHLMKVEALYCIILIVLEIMEVLIHAIFPLLKNRFAHTSTVHDFLPANHGRLEPINHDPPF